MAETVTIHVAKTQLSRLVARAEAGEEIVRVWAEKDRDQAAERGVDLAGYVAAVGAAREEMRATWAPLAGLLLRLAGDRAAR